MNIRSRPRCGGGILRRVKALTILAVLLVPSMVFAKSMSTRADGVADVGSDTQRTRDQAIANALKQAVGQVAGQWIQSEFTSRQAELSEKNRTEFVSQVEDKVKVDSQGFIESYKVLSEKTEGTVLRVSIEAVVNTKQLSDVYTALTEALGRRAMKVLVVSREHYEPAQPNVPALAPAFVEGELAKVGLVVQSGVTEPYTEDTASLAKRGKAKGVDVVVVVDAYYKSLGVIGPGAEFEALVGQTRAEVKLVVRSVLTANARVLSTQPVSMTTIGINFDRAVARALSGAGENAIKKSVKTFFEQLLEELNRVPQASTRSMVSVIVHRIKSYKAQAKPLTAIVQQVKGVGDVKEVKFSGDVLELAVNYAGAESDLASAILDSADHNRCCKAVDKQASGDGKVELTF